MENQRISAYMSSIFVGIAQGIRRCTASIFGAELRLDGALLLRPIIPI